MKEMKLVLWRIDGSNIPSQAGTVSALDVDFLNSPGLHQHLTDGWEIRSHTVVFVDGDIVLTLFVERPLVVPLDAAGI